jgi:hypothetical protein
VPHLAIHSMANPEANSGTKPKTPDFSKPSVAKSLHQLGRKINNSATEASCHQGISPGVSRPPLLFHCACSRNTP